MTISPQMLTLLLVIIGFIQAIVVSIAPLIYETVVRSHKIHRVENALPMIGKLKKRLSLIRDTLDADRVSVWYFSNGEQYYTGNPAQFANMLDEAINPLKPNLKSALISMTKIPISFFFSNLSKLHEKDYFTSVNDTIIKTELSQINSLYDVISNNAFKISLQVNNGWKFWKSKEPLWVGIIYVQYDHEYEMEEGEITFVKTQLAELALEIVESDKS
jgi:hypothetical protein